LDEEKDYQTNY